MTPGERDSMIQSIKGMLKRAPAWTASACVQDVRSFKAEHAKAVKTMGRANLPDGLLLSLYRQLCTTYSKSS